MATDYIALNQTFRILITELLGIDGQTVQAVRQNQGKLLPLVNGQLVTTAVINQNPIGWDLVEYTDRDDGDLDETIHGDRNVTFRVIAYGDQSINLIERLTMKIISDRSINYLNDANLGYINRSDVLSIAAIEQANFEERHQVDFDFHYIATETEIVNGITSAELNANLVWGRDFSSESLKGLINITNP